MQDAAKAAAAAAQQAMIEQKKDSMNKSRSGLMGVFKKYETQLPGWLTSTSAPETTARIDAIEKSLMSFRSATAELLCFTASAKVPEYFAENSDYELMCMVAVEKLRSHLAKLQPPVSSSAAPVASTSSTPGSTHAPQAHVKLERLRTPSYDGNPLEYQTFWDRFRGRYHDNPSISTVDKFEYLLGILSGPALSAVSGYSPTEANYQIAINTLQSRFGKKAPRIQAHVMQILDLPKGSGAKPSLVDLRHMANVIVINIRSLRAMGVLSASASTEVSAILGPVIFSRLPEVMTRRWYDLNPESDCIDVNNLIEFIERYVDNLEISRQSVASTSKPKMSSKPSFSSDEKSLSTLHLSTAPSNRRAQKPRVDHAFRGRSSQGSRPGNGPSFSLHGHSSNGSRPGNESSFSLLPGRSPTASSSTQPSASSRTHPPCPFCGDNHYPAKCARAKSLPPSEVIERVKKSSRCLCCFSHGHSADVCTFKPTCQLCFGTHLPLVCSKRSVQLEVHHCYRGSTPTRVFLQTVRVVVQGPSRSVAVRALLDSGSESSFIDAGLARALKLRPRGHPVVSINTFGGSSAKPTKVSLFRFEIRSPTDPSNSLIIDALDVNNISKGLHPAPSSLEIGAYPHLNSLSLSDYPSDEPIKLLIGADFYSEIMLDSVRKGPSGTPSAFNTLFGWTISGPSPFSSSSQLHVNLVESSVEDELSRFFSLESYGMEKESASSSTDVLDSFKSTIEHTGSAYQVRLPWKDSHPVLLSNERQASLRFDRLSSKLSANPSLKSKYTDVFSEYEKLGFIETVPDSCAPSLPVFYLPHRPVVRESSKTTKVRPVFDASCKGPNGVSLNDCLEVGPSLNPEIPDILLRFRLNPIGIVSDIKKAFLQLILHPDDRDVCRFFFFDGQTFRFRVVTFGITSSPFLLRATIQHHLSLQPESDAINEIEANCYVDNVFQGAQSFEEALDKSRLALRTFSSAGMSLSQWASNSKELISSLSDDGFELEGDKVVKLLGLSWDTAADTLLVAPVSNPPSKLTKRAVLSHLARIFDPLGFLSPLLVKGKLLIQRLWTLKLSWDDVISDPQLVAAIQDFIEDSSDLPSLGVPRCPFLASSVGVLHVFCDSSTQASVCCVYLRQSNDHRCVSNLLIARTKVVPTSFPAGRAEDLRIPRLELVSCLLGARLGHRVAASLGLDASTTVYWSDSQIALWWIKRPPSTPVFVRNRVQKIRELSDPLSWRHVPGVDNPADIPTRPNVSVSQTLTSSSWLHGPEWLLSDTWPTLPDFDDLKPSPPSLSVNAVDVAADDQFVPLFDVSRFSSLDRAIRVASWWILWISSKSFLSVPRELNSSHLDRAHALLIRQEQQSSFPSEFKLLESGSSVPLSSSLYPLHPSWDPTLHLIVSVGRERPDQPLILLPKQSHLSYLVLLKYHVLSFHSGVEATLGTSRAKYWIVSGRVMAKRVVRECTVCRRYTAVPYLQKESALPDIRSKPSEPFSVSGCDYAGPLYVKENTKVYVLLFTCASTRALHIEMTPDQSIRSFLLAFRRFSSRRGSPSYMVSDNAPTFKLASTLLPSIKWQFIPEKSPWWGGFYERLVRSIKSALRKSIGRSLVPTCDLETILVEIEDSINSRPLTRVGEDVANGIPLTPNCFLKPSCVTSSDNFNSTAMNLSSAWRRRQFLLKSFWKRWTDEYITQLHFWRQRSQVGSVNPALGDVVLLHQDMKHRGHWPLAIVHELIVGKDGHIRAAFVRIWKGGKHQILRRSTKHLYLLESVLPAQAADPADPVVSPVRSVSSVRSASPVRDSDPQPSASDPNLISSSLPGSQPDSSAVNPSSAPSLPSVPSTPIPSPRTRTGRLVIKPAYLKDYKL